METEALKDKANNAFRFKIRRFSIVLSTLYCQ